MLLRVMKHCLRLQECHLIHFLLPACLGLNHRMPTMSIEEAGLCEMKMMEKWQERAAKMMKEANSAWHKDGTSSAQEDEDAINFALLPDEALLASQLEGARRSSIEKAYNAALREVAFCLTFFVVVVYLNFCYEYIMGTEVWVNMHRTPYTMGKLQE